MQKKIKLRTHIACRASLCRSPAAFAPAKRKAKMARCARPLAYCPVYTAPTPKGKNPAKIPATVGFGPLPLPGGGGGGGTYPGAPEENVPGTKPTAPGAAPSIFAPRQSSQ